MLAEENRTGPDERQSALKASATSEHAGKALLFVTANSPAPVRSGAERRTKALLDVLIMEYRVTCVFIGGEHDIDAAKQAYPEVEWIVVRKRRRFGLGALSIFGEAGRRLSFVLDYYLLGDWSRTTRDKVLSRLVDRLERERKFSGIFVRYLAPAWQMGPRSLPVIADVDDNLEEMLRTTSGGLSSSLAGRLRAWHDHLMLRRYRRQLQRVAAALFTRNEDCQEFVGLTATYYAPNQFCSQELPRRSGIADGRVRLGLLGGALVAANQEGASWLLREIILPVYESDRLKHRVDFVIAGRMSDWMRATLPAAAAIPTIHFKGPLDDVADFYSNIDVALSPALSGAGTSVKFFEALALGVPVMATRFGARGYAGSADEGVFISDDPTAWRMHIERLTTAPGFYDSALRRVESAQERTVVSQSEFSTNVLTACAHLALRPADGRRA